DEVREADILLHVVDISHPGYEDQLAVVNKTLHELKADDKPTITIFNKMDLYEKNTFDEWLAEDTKKEILQDLYDRWNYETNDHAVFVSATEKRNVETLRTTILNKVKDFYKIRYPYKTLFY
ncbi:MAG TPA: GTPase HflX, partial [Niabella sp.]|nr:GTPase HflX [Niabella sp.]